MGSFSIWHWLIVLLVVVLIFGTKKLKNVGADLGGAVKGFKDGMKEGGTSADTPVPPQQPGGHRQGRGRPRQHGGRRGQDTQLSLARRPAPGVPWRQPGVACTLP